MKNCPFCAEEIRDEAIKCRHCGERLDAPAPAAETALACLRPTWASYAGLMVVAVLTAVLGIGLVLAVYLVLDRRTRRYTITPYRVSAEQGILSKKVDEVRTDHIRSLNVRQGLWGRITKHGDLLLGTAGTEGVEIVMRGIPRPVEYKEMIAKQGLRSSSKSLD